MLTITYRNNKYGIAKKMKTNGLYSGLMLANKKLAKNTLHLLHSDKLIMEILNASNEYLEQHAEIREKIED